jgi:hypothetical protein
MQHENPNRSEDTLAQVWRTADHRRTEELASWIGDVFRKGTTSAKSVLSRAIAWTHIPVGLPTKR